MAELASGTLNASAALQNLHIEGPPVQLPPQIALSLAIALHELLRNAQRYGALSTPLGVVSVKWETGPQSGKQWLKLRWQESGGPRVNDPSVRGFGARLVEQMLARDVNGMVQLRFEPQGVACDIAFPLSS
jgi:two-component sensor histidine kinase